MSMSDDDSILGNLGGLFADSVAEATAHIEQEEMRKGAQHIAASQVADLWPGEKVTITRNATADIPTKGRYTITRTYVEGHEPTQSG